MGTSQRKSLPCKWVFQYKARLVAKGIKQEHGVDFNELFLPIFKMNTLRLLLGVVVTKDFELEQIDVKKTFC